MAPSTRLAWISLLALGACATEELPTAEVAQDLTAAQRMERAALIRDAAAEMGVHNAALLGGIAISETGFAHCWSEATYACKGPASSSCGGGPIIAGSADGPCADQQGGLGMFQFDAGTYAQTVSTYGPTILTVEGNTAQAVEFVIERMQQSIAGVDDWMGATGWINEVPMVAGDPLTEQWADFLACRYNGCCSGSSLCNSRAAGYRDNAIDIYNEMGPAFWATADRCADLPASGLIEQRDACYLAGGDPRYWRRVTTGSGGTSEWTSSTTASAPSNFARWLLRPTAPVRVSLAVHIEGGAATAARYRVFHGGVTDTVTIDQTTAAGWVDLGEFELDGSGDEYVELGDDTGTAGQRIAFDALRVTDLTGPGGGGGSGSGEEPADPTGDGADGGCQVGGGTGPGASSLLGLVLLARRRRRRAAAAA